MRSKSLHATALGFAIALGLPACGGEVMTASTVAGLDLSNVIPLTEAVAIAEAQLPGGFIASAKLDLEDVGGSDPEGEPLSYEVAIFVNNELWHVGVNAETGAIVEKEIENEAAQD